MSQAHAHLEGLRKCGSCHALGDREVQAKCLECHQEIAERRDAGRGPHAQPAYARCVDCHVEHQGGDFALVHWPEGRENFDHGPTGFPLDGSHAGKDCR
ncbi:MAG: cytochrome c3 family protein, partial [Candidatus Krumholzibacteriia bacterium]